MIIATVLRSGGPTYTPAWVWALKRQLNEHVPPGTEFRVLSDLPLNHWRIALRHGWPGWWSKIEIFRPGVFPEGELVVYVDLDTLVTGDLTPLLSLDVEFAALTDFLSPKRIQTAVMAFRPGPTTRRIYERFLEGPDGHMQRFWSDQPFIEACVPDAVRIQDHVPGIYSLKKHARKGPPEDAMLVCGHGQPRFDDPAAGWAHRHWASLRAWAV